MDLVIWAERAVIDSRPRAAAVSLAQALVGLGLGTSKAGVYAAGRLDR